MGLLSMNSLPIRSPQSGANNHASTYVYIFKGIQGRESTSTGRPIQVKHVLALEGKYSEKETEKWVTNPTRTPPPRFVLFFKTNVPHFVGSDPHLDKTLPQAKRHKISLILLFWLLSQGRLGR